MKWNIILVLLSLLCVSNVLAAKKWITYASPEGYKLNFTSTTEYSKCFRFNAPEGNFHAIQFDPIIPDDAHLRLLVVWAVPYGSSGPIAAQTPDANGEISCDESESGYPFTQYFMVADHKSDKVKLDNDYGIPFGNSTGAEFEIQYYAIEMVVEKTTHDIVNEQIGMRIKYTDDLRDYNAGVLVSGIEDAMIRLTPGINGFPVRIYNPYPAPYFEDITFGYLSDFMTATNNLERIFDAIDSDEIELMYSLIHTNFLGINGTVRAYRNGYPSDFPAPRNLTQVFYDYGQLYETELIYQFTPPAASSTIDVIDYIDFSDYGNSWHEINFTINRGDSLELLVYYDTTGFSETIHGGFTGQRELANAIYIYKYGPNKLIVDPTANFMGNTYVDPSDPENFEE